MGESALIGIDLARVLSSALRLDEAGRYVVYRGAAGTAALSLRVSRIHVASNDSMGGGPAPAFVPATSDHSATVTLRLTYDLDALVFASSVLSAWDAERDHLIEITLPLEWDGTRLDSQDVPTPAEYVLTGDAYDEFNANRETFDNARSPDVPRITWVDYPFGHQHETLWPDMPDVVQRAHRVVPTRTWPDEFRVTAPQVGVRVFGAPGAGVDQREDPGFLSHTAFPDRHAGDPIGNTASDALAEAVAKAFNAILQASVQMVKSLGPGGARTVTLVLSGDKLFFVGLPPAEHDANTRDIRASDALAALARHQQSRPAWDAATPWDVTARLFLSPGLIEQSLKFYVGRDDARRAATAGVTEADIAPVGADVEYQPDAPWFEWLGRYATMQRGEELDGSDIYYGRTEFRWNPHLGFGRTVESDDDRRLLRVHYIDSLDFTFWPLFYGPVQVNEDEDEAGSYFVKQAVVSEPSVQLTDGATMVEAQRAAAPAGEWWNVDQLFNGSAVDARTLPGGASPAPFFPEQDLVVKVATDLDIAGGLDALPAHPLDLATAEVELYARLGLGPFVTPGVQTWAPTEVEPVGLLGGLVSMVDFILPGWPATELFDNVAYDYVGSRAARAARDIVDLVAGLVSEGDLSVGLLAPDLGHPRVLRLAFEALGIPRFGVRATPPPTLVQADMSASEGIELAVAFDIRGGGVESITPGVEGRAYGDAMVRPLLVAMGGDDPTSVISVVAVNTYDDQGVWLACDLELSAAEGPLDVARMFEYRGRELDLGAFLLLDASALERLAMAAEGMEAQLVEVERIGSRGWIDPGAVLWAARLDNGRWLSGAISPPGRPDKSIREIVRTALAETDDDWAASRAVGEAFRFWQTEFAGLPLDELSEHDPAAAELESDLVQSLERFVDRAPPAVQPFITGARFWITGDDIGSGRLLSRLAEVSPADHAWSIDDERAALAMRMRVGVYLRDRALGTMDQELVDAASDGMLDELTDLARARFPDYTNRLRPEHAVRAVAAQQPDGRIRALGLSIRPADAYFEDEIPADPGLGTFRRWTHRRFAVSLRAGLQSVANIQKLVRCQARWVESPSAKPALEASEASEAYEPPRGEAFANSVDWGALGVAEGGTGLVSELVSERLELFIDVDEATIKAVDHIDRERQTLTLELTLTMPQSDPALRLTWREPVPFRVVHFVASDKLREAAEAHAVAGQARGSPDRAEWSTALEDFTSPAVDDLLGDPQGPGPRRGLRNPVVVSHERLRAHLRRVGPRMPDLPPPPPPPRD